MTHSKDYKSILKQKVAKVMGEFKRGKLLAKSGGKVADKSQAIAIALSEARRKVKNG